MRARIRRHRSDPERRPPQEEYIDIDAAALTGVFAAPRWLRDVGFTAWLLVGVALFLVGSIWLLTLTNVIVAPLIAAGVIAAVAAPLMAWLESHRVPRPLGAILLLVGFIVLGAGVVYMVLAGITSQTGDLTSHLSDAKNTIEGWLKDLGVDPAKAKDAKQDASSSSTQAVSALLSGLGAGIKELSSLVFFLAMTLLSLIFLLADGPKIRAWGERHMGVPAPIARTISRRTLGSLRGYFLGVTLVAAFNALVVGVGAVLLGVPQAGTIAIVTLLAAYVPYLGAWTAGAFAVLIALGDPGPETALAMAVIVLLANGIFQQLVQPVAYGAALGLNPLAVLIVTIAGGCLFGTVGLVLSAPLVSAAVKISADLAGARAAERGEKDQTEEPPPAGSGSAPEPRVA